MSQPPSESSVRAILSAKVPQGVTIEAIRAVPSPHLKRIYEIQLSNSQRLILALAPSVMLRLLRSEQLLIRSEVELIKWLRDILSKHDQTGRIPTGSKGDQETCISSDTDEGGSKRLGGDLAEDLDLRFLPSLVAHSYTTKELGSAYNLFSHISGHPVSSLPTPLTAAERRHLDIQTGCLVRQFARVESPSGKFGPALAVLTPPTVPQRHAGSGGIISSGGAGNWSIAFQAMLESILRDAEDMAVTIAYGAIRRNIRRLGYLLDGVTIPRMVILDATDDSNIMVEKLLPRQKHQQVSPPKKKAEEKGKPEQSEAEDDSSDEEGEEENDTPKVLITGLRDWSRCVFGDPLLATIFDDRASDEFLQGFNGREERSSTPLGYDEELIEDKEFSYIRLLLYQCYHATVSIVQEFYRPRNDSRDRELAARRKLNSALSKLQDIDDNPKRRHRRPSGELSPAKKPKADDED